MGLASPCSEAVPHRVPSLMPAFVPPRHALLVIAVPDSASPGPAVGSDGGGPDGSETDGWSLSKWSGVVFVGMNSTFGTGAGFVPCTTQHAFPEAASPT